MQEIQMCVQPWVGNILWRRKWEPTPIFLPGKSQRQSSLVGYIPWGRKELDFTEHAIAYIYYYINIHNLAIIVNVSSHRNTLKVQKI